MTQRRVLVVDDDPAIRLVTKRMLKNMQCEAYEAKDGVEGERLANELLPDLVLLDIMMPLQDGYETCARLRRGGYMGRIVLFSALMRDNERNRAKVAGATGYIQKPVTREELEQYLEGFTEPQV
ncbi:MAG TPA: response regulator [Aggregatilineales bacterium]|nr:response regulator [Anaerolineales bacterium]HRE49240.1 response regulator [Aggregatilineales bacterium]